MEEPMIELEQSEMARSSDPNYNQICGMVSKKVIAKTKMICFSRGITQSEAIEEALDLWVKVNEKKEEGDH